MSADNFYVLRKHPNGYCFVMGFASADEQPCHASTCDVSDHNEVFPTITDAMEAWHKGQEFDEENGGWPRYYNEYGLSYSPEVEADIKALESPKPPQIIRVTFGYELETIIGQAEVHEDGTAHITIQDQRIVEAIKANQKIDALNIVPTPALPSKETKSLQSVANELVLDEADRYWQRLQLRR